LTGNNAADFPATAIRRLDFTYFIGDYFDGMTGRITVLFGMSAAA
jgi:hypothetical protein